MMTKKEYSFLASYLRPDDIMLEYGSGKSSCVWSKFVAYVHSIEDSRSWAKFQQTNNADGANREVYLARRDREQPPATGHRPPSSMAEYSSYVYKGHSVSEAIGSKFDVVLVDGRARPQCAFHALDILSDSPHSAVFLHDYPDRQGEAFKNGVIRTHYFIVERWYDLVKVVDSLALLVPKPEHRQHHPAFPRQELPDWWWSPMRELDIRRECQMPPINGPFNSFNSMRHPEKTSRACDAEKGIVRHGYYLSCTYDYISNEVPPLC